MKAKMSPLVNWMTARRTNLLIAAIVAIGFVAALSTFAAGSTPRGKACPAGVKQWAASNGWKASGTFDCSVNWKRIPRDDLPGKVAEQDFRKIRTSAQLGKFLRSNSPNARGLRKTVKPRLSAAEYKAWLSGKNHVAVQFNRDAKIVGNTFIDENGNVQRTSPGHQRAVKAGDVLFVFVYKGKVNANGNMRVECGNAVINIRPEARQHPKKGKLLIEKYIDKNANGKRDKGEKAQSGVKFKIEDIGTKKTNKQGRIAVSLPPDTYTVREIVPKGYDATTDVKREVKIPASKTKKVQFGNKREEKKKQPTPAPVAPQAPAPVAAPPVTTQEVPSPTPTPTVAPTPTVTPTPSPTPTPVCTENGSLKITAYVDSNGNGKRDQNEQPKPNTTFSVVKAGETQPRQVITAADGTVVVDNMTPGSYAVSEELLPMYTNAQKSQNVTIVNCKQAELTYANRPVATPGPEEVDQPVVAPQPKSVPQAVVNTVADLPATGQGGLIVLATVLAATGLYYGERAYLKRRRKKNGK